MEFPSSCHLQTVKKQCTTYTWFRKKTNLKKSLEAYKIIIIVTNHTWWRLSKHGQNVVFKELSHISSSGLPEVLHELWKRFSPFSKRHNDINNWSRNVNHLVLHFHEWSKGAEEGHVSVLHKICFLKKEFIVCAFISLSAIIA